MKIALKVETANFYLAPNVCLEIEEKLTETIFSGAWSKFLLWLDFSSGDLSNCFDLDFSSMVWSHSWLAGVKMWGKTGIYSFCICYSFLVAYMTSEEHVFRLLLKCPMLFQGFFLISKILIIFISILSVTYSPHYGVF